MNASKLFDLSGKVALVTGASRGLGLQMAEALGEMGAKVAISARRQNWTLHPLLCWPKISKS
jgi:NAD(P)-dependent dehydrogenase (short-subunit alcohol dehydrogenase family)